MFLQQPTGCPRVEIREYHRLEIDFLVLTDGYGLPKIVRGLSFAWLRATEIVQMLHQVIAKRAANTSDRCGTCQILVILGQVPCHRQELELLHDLELRKVLPMCY